MDVKIKMKLQISNIKMEVPIIMKVKRSIEVKMKMVVMIKMTVKRSTLETPGRKLPGCTELKLGSQ